jgi:hypothetical protein
VRRGRAKVPHTGSMLLAGDRQPRARALAPRALQRRPCPYCCTPGPGLVATGPLLSRSGGRQRCRFFPPPHAHALAAGAARAAAAGRAARGGGCLRLPGRSVNADQLASFPAAKRRLRAAAKTEDARCCGYRSPNKPMSNQIRMAPFPLCCTAATAPGRRETGRHRGVPPCAIEHCKPGINKIYLG